VQYFSGKLPLKIIAYFIARRAVINVLSPTAVLAAGGKLLTEKIKSSIQILLVMFKVQSRLLAKPGGAAAPHFYFDFALNFYLDMYTFDDFKTFKIL
jgi:hypothetical protein